MLCILNNKWYSLIINECTYATVVIMYMVQMLDLKKIKHLDYTNKS